MEDAKSIIDAVERLSTPDLIGNLSGDGPHAIDGLALAIVSEGKRIVDLTPYLDALRDAPRRIETIAAVTTIASLIDYVNRFKLGDSALFADDTPDKPSLLGVIDFHGGAKPATCSVTQSGGEKIAIEQPYAGGDSTPGSAATPRFGRHSVRYDFPISEQIRAWANKSGEPMGHVEMASFLEERKYDIANPPLDWMQVDRQTVELILHLMNIHDDQGEIDDARADEEPGPEGDDRYIPRSALYKLRQIRFASAQRLVQMARTVEIAANAKTVEGFQPKTGERTLIFTEEHETRDNAGRKVIVPDAFLLQVPLWEGETPLLVPVRLQYRRVGGRVAWIFTLIEWQRVIRFAVKTEAERVRQATELPLFYGARSA